MTYQFVQLELRIGTLLSAAEQRHKLPDRARSSAKRWKKRHRLTPKPQIPQLGLANLTCKQLHLRLWPLVREGLTPAEQTVVLICRNL